MKTLKLNFSVQLLFVSILLSSCASIAYKSLLSKDNRGSFTYLSDYIKAHEENLRSFPNSKYAPMARQKLEKLKQKNEELQTMYEQFIKEDHSKKLSEQIAKIQSYKEQFTTWNQFKNDGWTARDAGLGFIGIIESYTNEITLGRYSSPATEGKKYVYTYDNFTSAMEQQQVYMTKPYEFFYNQGRINYYYNKIDAILIFNSTLYGGKLIRIIRDFYDIEKYIKEDVEKEKLNYKSAPDRSVRYPVY